MYAVSRRSHGSSPSHHLHPLGCYHCVVARIAERLVVILPSILLTRSPACWTVATRPSQFVRTCVLSFFFLFSLISYLKTSMLAARRALLSRRCRCECRRASASASAGRCCSRGTERRRGRADVAGLGVGIVSAGCRGRVPGVQVSCRL
jgi:hypothetical protein